MTIPVLCVLCAAAGVAAGHLLTRRITDQDLHIAWRRGRDYGLSRQANRVAFLEGRVARLEGSIRRITTTNGVRP